MSFIVNAVMWIVNFLFSKKSISIATIPLKVVSFTLTSITISLYLSSIVLFVNFLVKLFNVFFDVIHKANHLSVASGSALGMSLNDYLNVALSFISASGIGPAFLNALSLGFSLLFLYLAYYIPRLISKVFSEVNKKIQDEILVIGS
ncbi:hypothetical protein [Caminibacter mediatlanticus]|uniref:Uncharacterized protein n=1 Tax=Caminibacter mediatlanticus TB-2 TaxID=391592 RepID=A0AAI9AG34_9BACT|nr:hypothetical protein [Caminibacter mediatlanticus]EDM22859.1 hypothetical protein CMTB2_04112 [Caminibacter mediatlanticus TB-2]